MKRARFFEKIRDAFAHTFNFDAYRNGLRRQYENKILNDYGMSLEEYFAAHPEAKSDYDQLGLSKIDKKWNQLKESIKTNPHVKAAIENITGERDTAENAKNREFQSEEATIARVWQEEQAKAAREWDSIGAQMERAAAVGVNPISIAMQNGGIGSSATTSIPSTPGIPAGSASLMHSGMPDLAATVFQGIGTFAEQRLKQSQADDIVAMRQYNIAEKMANTDHLKALCKGVELSNTAQEIQNTWLDRLNEIEYYNGMKDLGVKDSTIIKNRASAKLDLQQIDACKQDMRLALERFNATLPLEVQLSQAQIANTKMSTKEIYEEICLRHLQQIEQENRNVQSAAEAESAGVQAGIARATYEDAINAFHNDMVKGAAEAGVAYNDYVLYGVTTIPLTHLPSRQLNNWLRFGKRKFDKKNDVISPVKGVNFDLIE